jgi:hypothetical protein
MRLRLATAAISAALAAGAVPASAGVIAFQFGHGEMVMAPGMDFGGGPWGAFGPLGGTTGGGARAWFEALGGYDSGRGGDLLSFWLDQNARGQGRGSNSASNSGEGGGSNYVGNRGGSGRHGGHGGAGGGSGSGGGYGYGGSHYGQAGWDSWRNGEGGFQFGPIDPGQSWHRSPWVNTPWWQDWRDGKHYHGPGCGHDDGSGSEAVPEPGTLLLLGSGLLVASRKLRRR